MKLLDLLSGIRYKGDVSSQTKIERVLSDSQQVQKNDLFLAMPSVSGKDIAPYVKEAIEKGAKVVLCSKETARFFQKSSYEKSLVIVSDMLKARAKIAAKLNPRQPAHLAAVTGTNGKTSSVHFFAQLCQGTQKSVGTIGTLGVTSSVSLKQDFLSKKNLTSPDPFLLHKILNEMATEGVKYGALEASSHGLQQKRLDAIELDVAAFTNLSHDHLDYHQTMEAYFAAKTRLFSELLKPGFTAVLNMDESHGHVLEKICKDRRHSLIRYGREGNELRLLDVILFEGGQRLTLDLLGKEVVIEIPLVGVFQVYNILCAIGMAIGVGLKIEDIIPCLENLQNVPGRLEFIGKTKAGGGVFVDYAHTSDALESALTSLKPHVKGLLTVVFGCGGDRDSEKRPLMGRVAWRHAQKIYVTDDNPRTEDPEMIRQQIITACPGANNVGNRLLAIEKALKGLQKGNVCLIAGKGHETGQLVGDTFYDFDDREVVREFLEKHGGTLA